MTTQQYSKQFLDSEDLVAMGLYDDKRQVFRLIKSSNNVPPHIRLSKKIIKFPSREFFQWLRAQTVQQINNSTQEV